MLSLFVEASLPATLHPDLSVAAGRLVALEARVQDRQDITLAVDAAALAGSAARADW